MLGKLFKHEWKRTSKMGSLMLVGILVMTLLGVLGFSLPFSYAIQNEEFGRGDETGFVIMIMIAVATMIVYMMTLMGVVYGMLIYMGVHMYKTTYSDEGYLTHTLPVTSHQIILSKVLNAGIWYVLVSICMMLSIVVLIFSMLFFMEGADGFAREMNVMWNDLADLYAVSTGFQVARGILTVLLMFLVTPFSTMMILFGSLSIGQLASKYRAVMGILAYFGVCMVNSVISYIIQMVTMFGNSFGAAMTNTEMNPMAVYDGTIITSALMMVGFYFVSHAIISKKLNLE